MKSHLRTSRKEDRYLGTIHTEIVGRQYYESPIHPGEEVILEREPGNVHDSNAIRVNNLDFNQIGHLPRPIAAWLAPLIDSGKVRAGGIIPPAERLERREPRFSIPCTLKMYLAPKGRDILQPNSDPANAPQGLHETIRQAYLNAAGYSDPGVVRELGERLNAFARRELLPETSMLLALFPAVADEIRRRNHEKTNGLIREAFKRIHIGRAVTCENLSLFPLYHRNGHPPAYTLLQNALQNETAKVEEVSEAGSIPEILIRNLGTIPLLVPEGEVLIGARQNRIVNLTFIVPAQTTSKVPVSCVEQGRWSGSSHFQSTSWSHPAVRKEKTKTVLHSKKIRGTAHSDQNIVWREVNNCLNSLEVDSPTRNMAEAYTKHQERLDALRSKLQLPENACGFVMTCGNRILGVDWFDSPDSLKVCWDRLANSYFLEAIPDQARRRRTAKQIVSDFLKSVGESIQISSHSEGAGIQLEIRGTKSIGTAVWFEKRICHLSAFPNDTERRRDEPSDASRNRD